MKTSIIYSNLYGNAVDKCLWLFAKSNLLLLFFNFFLGWLIGSFWGCGLKKALINAAKTFNLTQLAVCSDSAIFESEYTFSLKVFGTIHCLFFTVNI